MPVVRVWGVSDKDRSLVSAIHTEIICAVLSVEQLDLSDPKEVTVFFPADVRSMSVSPEIIVEVTGLFEKPERTEEVLALLARRIGVGVREQAPETERIECFIRPFKPAQGFWSSDQDSA